MENHQIKATRFGSLNDYEKGSIQLISGEASNYAFSNIFEVASQSAPYEKSVVGMNLKFVIESLKAEGTSPWFTASHDEFVIVMDGEIRVDYIKLDQPLVDEAEEGTRLAGDNPQGKKMGHAILKQGHQAILPAGSAYRFEAAKPGVILIQTIKGPLSVEKWHSICIQ
ncbi:hydroxyquinol 1,2-dioxygenase [Neisseria shayeganii]|uniref:Hydroxyquinol 1,2-dioxygenase n=1 Tax=Neisseria shayeganii TaxID=607712 RepID=A0A7D7N5R5_9NEIS|nr:hydroxyquinol 1,2-dioxygenase [Neisseria shayeganii]QMT40303.1 hydroxyquinol 1,2-dioxygenase [Neisseria shayeganii]